MYYFQKNNHNILFHHIPRNAGKHIRNHFFNNSWQIKDFETSVFGDCDANHATISQIVSSHKGVEIDKCDKFVVARNPVERFKSALIYFMYLGEEELKKLEDKEYFYFFMTKKKLVELITSKREGAHSPSTTYYRTYFGAYNTHNNWFKQQIEYINTSTEIYKIEDGVNDNFCEWVSDIFKIKFKNMHNEETVDSENELIKIPDEFFNQKIVDNITDFYQIDFEYFKYE